MSPGYIEDAALKLAESSKDHITVNKIPLHSITGEKNETVKTCRTRRHD